MQTTDTNNPIDETEPGAPDPLAAQLAASEQKAAEYLLGWQRAKADFVNREKEIERQRSELVQYANARTLRTILPVYDALRIACEHMTEAEATEWTRGMEQICTQFEKALTELGVTRIDAINKPFDPMQHEAVARRPGGDGTAPNTITEEVGAGYMLHNATLIPAKVILAE